MKARRIIIPAVLVIMAALMGAGVAAASGPPDATTHCEPPAQRIRFSLGATSATINGTTSAESPSRYVFHARAGQTAHISFDAPPELNWTLADPNGQPLKTTMSEARNATVTLPTTGDYDLTVVGTSRAAFRLTLEIQPPLSAATQVQRIQFASGDTSATVTGTANEGVHLRYVFRAHAGQVAHVRITSPTDDANWAITGPSGQPLKRMASEARSGVVALPTTGDYQLAIGAPRSGTIYRLTLEIPAR
jgi:hypothetical protein